MAIGRFLFPFFAGVAVGALLHKHWPEIKVAAQPLLRSSLRHGSNLLEKGRVAYHAKTERLVDLIEEIRETDAAAAAEAASSQGSGPGGAAPPPGGKGGSKPPGSGIN